MLGLGNTVTKQLYVSSAAAEYDSTVYLEFDGVNEYGELSGSGKETFLHAVGTTGGTISFWVRSSDIYHSGSGNFRYMIGGFAFSSPNVNTFYIATKNDSGTNRIVTLRSDLNVATGTSTVWSDFKTDSADHLSDNTWHHIAVTIKPHGSSWRTLLFVDGTGATLTTHGSSVNASNSSDPSAADFPQTIARYNTIYSAMDINEMASWSTELSSSEISYIYNQGLTGFDFTQNAGDYTSASDLYTWHTMGEKDETESIEPDSSGNNRDMTLFNAPSRLTH